MVKVVSVSDRGVVQTFGSNILFPLNMFTHWMGPIPEADPPFDE